MFDFRSKESKKKLNPKEQLREWTKGLRHEKRGLERQLRKIEREENKVKREIKASAKKGDVAAVKILAKEIVRSQKAKNQIRLSCVTMNSVELQLKQQAAMAKVAGVLGKSADVMQHMGRLMNIPSIQANMRKMAREMAQAGLIQETMDEMMDDALGDDELDDEAEEEVNKVMMELTGGMFGNTTAVPDGPVAAPASAPAVAAPASAPAAAVAAGGAGGGAGADDMDDMQARLAALDTV